MNGNTPSLAIHSLDGEICLPCIQRDACQIPIMEVRDVGHSVQLHRKGNGRYVVGSGTADFSMPWLIAAASVLASGSVNVDATL